MTSPRFRLTSLLNLREARLAEAVQAMARIEGTLRTLEQTRDRLVAERAEVLTRAVPIGAVRAADLDHAIRYLDALDRQELVVRTEIARTRDEVARARAVVRERMQAADVLRRLRDRHAEQVRREEVQRERRAVDELTTIKAGIERQLERESCP